MAHTRKNALFVGGCQHNFHFLEPAIPSVQAVCEALGMALEVRGVYHPERFPEKSAFTGEVAGDYSALNAEILAHCDLLILFTTGEKQGEDTSALLQFVRQGGALVGIHCAADSFVSDADYIAAIGGRFRTHPAPLDIAVEFVDTGHPITQGLAPFTVRDELYLFRDYDPNRVHLLAQTRSYTADPEQGAAPIPICWTRTEGKGRIFYCSLGHFPEVMENTNWRELVTRGAKWTLAR